MYDYSDASVKAAFGETKKALDRPVFRVQTAMEAQKNKLDLLFAGPNPNDARNIVHADYVDNIPASSSIEYNNEARAYRENKRKEPAREQIATVKARYIDEEDKWLQERAERERLGVSKTSKKAEKRKRRKVCCRSYQRLRI